MKHSEYVSAVELLDLYEYLWNIVRVKACEVITLETEGRENDRES